MAFRIYLERIEPTERNSGHGQPLLTERLSQGLHRTDRGFWTGQLPEQVREGVEDDTSYLELGSELGDFLAGRLNRTLQIFLVSLFDTGQSKNRLVRFDDSAFGLLEHR